MRFIEQAMKNFAHLLLVPGNHDHYDGVFDDTSELFRRHLPGVRVLDNEHVDIDGVRFFGTTLWSDFEDRSTACMDGLRRRMGEFFFVRKRAQDAEGRDVLAKFRPEDALDAFDAAWLALRTCVAARDGKTTVVVSHHAPSRKGLNPRHVGNGLDGAYASDLDTEIASWEGVPVWVHGHTHIRRTYRIGGTAVMANCRGFEGKDLTARTFSANAFFDL
jgi:Icc-related predicted phosphoesterase